MLVSLYHKTKIRALSSLFYLFIYVLTCANKHRLIMAMDEWVHEAYSDKKKSFPAALTSDCFKRFRRSDSSEDVSKIKFKA